MHHSLILTLEGDTVVPNVANVQNTEGKDISATVNFAAEQYELDAVWLLALLKAESGLNPRAERWGRRTAQAKEALQVLGLL